MPTTTGLATSFITFSRPGASGGGATTTDRDGKIKWAGHNLLPNSESFDASTWSKANVTVSANNVVAPNGTTTADRIVEQAVTDRHFINQNDRISASNTLFPHTLAVFAKAGERQYINLSIEWSTNYVAATFDLSGGTVTSNRAGGTGTSNTSTITAVGSGWYLCTLTGILGTAGSNGAVIAITDTATPTGASGGTYLGDATKGLYLWGAHLYRSDLGGMQLNPAMPAGMQSYYPTTVRNLLGYSEDFTTGWQRTGIAAFGSGSVANAVVAPNGLQNADKIVPTAANALHAINNLTAITVVSGTPYYGAVYIKAAEYGFAFVSLNVSASSTNAGVCVNLADGTQSNAGGSGAYTITSAGDGWWRIAIRATASSANGYLEVWPRSTAGGPVAYAADGTSGIYLWGAQLSDSASLDTYVPVYGAAVTSAAYYAPRLDFDPVTLAAKGLLVEEQRVNLLLHSNAFDNAAWTKLNSTVTANAATSPDGTASAEKLVEDTTNGVHAVLPSSFPTITSGISYTLSVFAKAAERTRLYLRDNGTASVGAYFDLSSGAVVQNEASVVSSSIIAVGSGWYRCSVTYISGATSANPQVRLVSTGTTVSYTGDGTSGLLIYGAQLEAGSFSTSYIPNGSAVAGATRAADVASVSTGAFPFNLSEGSLVWSYTNFGSANNNGRVVATGVPGSNSYGVFAIVSSATQNQGFIRDISGDAISGLTYTANQTINKGAAGYKVNDFAFTSNGAVALTSSSGVVPSQTTAMHLGRAINSDSAFLNGHIRQITYLPRRISNAELQSRTA